MVPIEKIAATSCLLLVMITGVSANNGKNEHRHGPSVNHREHKDEALGIGMLNTINSNAASVNITHGPLPDIGWPAMTMDLPVLAKVNLGAFSQGAKVQFAVKRGEDNVYRITRMCVTVSDEVIAGLCQKDAHNHDKHDHHGH